MVFRRVIYWVSARCLHWFYREHRVVGGGQVPATGPVLLVGNHPNDLPDVIAGLYVSPRHPRYLATVSVTTNPIARAMYEAMGVIPVARVRDARKMKADGVDMAAVNQAAADAVQAALGAGEVVAVFPEGGVHDGPQLGKFRTGVARMLLAYLDGDSTRDVTVVPFGHQYEAPRTWGSDLITAVGAPWSARAWLQGQPPDQRGPAACTDRLREAVLGVTRQADSEAEAVVRDELVAAMAACSAPRDPLAVAPAMVTRAAELAADALGDGPSPISVRVRTAAHVLARAVENAGGLATSAVDHARLLHALDVTTAAAPVPTMVLWLGLPAAAIGWAVHGPILPLVHATARRVASARTDLVARCFVPGLYLVLAWWLLVTLLAAVVLGAAGGSPLWALLVLVSLPRFGDLAIGWKSWFAAWRLVRTAHRWGTAERQALREQARILEAWVGAAEHQIPHYSAA